MIILLSRLSRVTQVTLKRSFPYLELALLHLAKNFFLCTHHRYWNGECPRKMFVNQWWTESIYKFDKYME